MMNISKNTPFYLPAVDSLRFLGFVLVFFRHFASFIPSQFLYKMGWIGVELFFMISAFLLTRIFVKEYKQYGSVQLFNFYRRRLLRIFPLYFLYLFLITLLSIYKINSFHFNRLLGNVFFVDNIISSIKGYNPNPFSFHLWSISLEWQFYLIVPFLIWIVLKKPRNLIFIFSTIYLLLIVARLLAAYYHLLHPFIYVLPISGDSFLLGILLGLGIFDNKIQKANTVACLIGCVVILIICYYLPSRFSTGYHHVYVYTLISIAFLLLMIATIYSKNQLVNAIFQNKVIIYLGKISYGLYIYHIVSIYLTNVFCKKLHITLMPWSLPISLLITICFSILSYELFEKYFLKKKRSLSTIQSLRL